MLITHLPSSKGKLYDGTHQFLKATLVNNTGKMNGKNRKTELC